MNQDATYTGNALIPTRRDKLRSNCKKQRRLLNKNNGVHFHSTNDEEFFTWHFIRPRLSGLSPLL